MNLPICQNPIRQNPKPIASFPPGSAKAPNWQFDPHPSCQGFLAQQLQQAALPALPAAAAKEPRMEPKTLGVDCRPHSEGAEDIDGLWWFSCRIWKLIKLKMIKVAETVKYNLHLCHFCVTSVRVGSCHDCVVLKSWMKSTTVMLTCWCT